MSIFLGRTYGLDLAYASVYFCCSAGSNRPSRKRAVASSLESARFLLSGKPLPSRDGLSSVLRFMLLFYGGESRVDNGLISKILGAVSPSTGRSTVSAVHLLVINIEDIFRSLLALKHTRASFLSPLR